MAQGSKTLYWTAPATIYIIDRERVTGRGRSRRVIIEKIEKPIPAFSSIHHQLVMDHCRNYDIPFRKIKRRAG